MKQENEDYKMQKIEIGKTYLHYKGGIYKIINFAKHSETQEEMIVYQSQTTKDVWVRPKRMWSETIDENNTLRFTLMD